MQTHSSLIKTPSLYISKENAGPTPRPVAPRLSGCVWGGDAGRPKLVQIISVDNQGTFRTEARGENKLESRCQPCREEGEKRTAEPVSGSVLVTAGLGHQEACSTGPEGLKQPHGVRGLCPLGPASLRAGSEVPEAQPAASGKRLSVCSVVLLASCGKAKVGLGPLAGHAEAGAPEALAVEFRF